MQIEEQQKMFLTCLFVGSGHGHGHGHGHGVLILATSLEAE
jgi:hypothetical protein